MHRRTVASLIVVVQYGVNYEDDVVDAGFGGNSAEDHLAANGESFHSRGLPGRLPRTVFDFIVAYRTKGFFGSGDNL